MKLGLMKACYTIQRPSVRIPTAHYDDFDEVPMSTGLGTLGTMDFAVTRDFSVLRDTVRPESKEVTRKEHSPKVKRKLSLPEEEEEEEESPQNQEPNLHEMSMYVSSFVNEDRKLSKYFWLQLFVTEFRISDFDAFKCSCSTCVPKIR